MYNKYKNKTYTQGIQKEVSDTENESKIIITNNNDKNSSDAEQDKCLKTTFQSKSIFTKQNNNISFYQSTSKNSYRKSANYKSIAPLIDTKYSSSTAYTSTQSFGEEQFSYNYTALKRDSTNRLSEKNENQNTQRINVDELINKFQKPKRTIKSYKKQFNMQKSDNFNMLSYKPMEYNSDINLNINRKSSKINQIYRKQEVDKIFYPSKKTLSPEPTIEKDDKNDKYKTSSLKYKSFFGSYEEYKNSRVAKSTSKLKIHQLNDFNIDKLIEIGDKYANLHKPILPLGQRMNNNLMHYNKIKFNKYKIPYTTKFYNNYSYDMQDTPIFAKYSKIKYNIEKEGKNINKTNIIKEKKRVTKKVVSKNILKNSKLCNDDNKEDIPMNSITKILNFNDETTNNETNTFEKLKKIYINKSKKDVTNLTDNEKNTEIKKIQEINQNVKLHRRRTYLNVYQKQRVINIDKDKKEKSLINNNRNEKQIVKNILSEPKLLTDDKNNYRFKILNKKYILENKDKLITEVKQYNKNNIISSKTNICYNGIKPKNYYGQDERHNLEDIIDNNSYLESIHYKKKISNYKIEKVI